MKVVTVGDNCMDVYKSSGQAYPGGNPVNVSIYLRNLGAETAYVGWVGSDQYGDIMMDAIQRKGVNISHITKKEGKTATTQVELVDNERQFGDYDEGVMASFSLSRDDLDFVKSFDCVHSAIWGHTDTYFPVFKENGMVTFFDFSDKLDHDLVKTLPVYVDYPFFSYSEDDAFIRNFLKEMHALGPKVAVATLGENGSLAYDGELFYTCGVVETKVIDTMGAGDSFIAGFIYGILKRNSIQECLKLGAETASKTIRYFGAW